MYFIIIPFFIVISYWNIDNCECKMWFKKLNTSSKELIDGPIYETPPAISGAAATVQDSIGPYGAIYMDLITDNDDKIICKKLAKGDSALLPKFENFLKKQDVKSAKSFGGKKVYSIFPFWIRIVPYSGKMRKRKTSKGGF